MKKVYFVHDEQEHTTARKNFLEMAGFSVKLLRDSRELFVELADEQPDLVILDILIQGQNGFEVAREMNERFHNRKFPVVLCSRIYRARQFREEAKRCGADAYYLMPMNLDEFLRRITRVMEQFHPQGDDGELDVAAA